VQTLNQMEELYDKLDGEENEWREKREF